MSGRHRSRGPRTPSTPPPSPPAPPTFTPVALQTLLLGLIAVEAEKQAAASVARLERRFSDAIESAHQHWPEDVERWHERREAWTPIKFSLRLVTTEESLVVSPVVCLIGGAKTLRFFLCRRGLVQLEAWAGQRLPLFLKEPRTIPEADEQARSIVKLAIRVLEQATDPFPQVPSAE